ncbi:MAG: hypothetical protein R3Y67_02625, partial [Eubacteriales bacterium]
GSITQTDGLVTNIMQEKEEEIEMCKLVEVCLEEGRVEGRVEGATKNSILLIANLMETMEFTMEEAMNALKIPEEERKKYVELIG